MTFKEATDQLMAGRVTLREIAAACGVSENLAARARMDGEGSRTAPKGWRAALAQLARERSGELAGLADELGGTPGQ